MTDPIACVVSGHAWMRFEDDEWMMLVCARPDCRIKVKVKKPRIEILQRIRNLLWGKKP